jgi:anaerobic selenocysteine-containing dehydrogenase
MITFREIMHTKSRTSGNYWLQALLPENSVVMNKADARAAGLESGDWVRVVSASNTDGAWPLGNGRKRPVVGKVHTVEGMRPGVLAFSLGHGHWAYGASDIEVDGDTIRGDERRAKGLHANASMRVDPHLGDVTISDMAGGSAVFYDTRVRLERASEDESRVVKA